jgi:competence ComEA-like helix-hairpin-helix protein
MPSPAERKALLFLATAVLLGTGVRAVRALSDAPRGQADSPSALALQIAAVEKVRSDLAAGKAAAMRNEVVNVNSATVAQLQSLPRVGPVLAQRIKAYRDSAGPFSSLEQLDRVKGIGPAMLKGLAPRVTFSPNQRLRDAPSFR